MSITVSKRGKKREMILRDLLNASAHGIELLLKLLAEATMISLEKLRGNILVWQSTASKREFLNSGNPQHSQ
jgi:hypothetical protein